MVDQTSLKNMMMTHVKGFIKVFDLIEVTIKSIKEDKITSDENMRKIVEMYKEHQKKDMKKIQKFKKRVKRMFGKQRSKSRKRKFSVGSKSEKSEETLESEIKEEEKGNKLNQTFEKMITDLEDFLKKSFSGDEFLLTDFTSKPENISRENVLDEDQTTSPVSQTTPSTSKKSNRSKTDSPFEKKSKMQKKEKENIVHGDKEMCLLEKEEESPIQEIQEVEYLEIETVENYEIGNLAKVDIDDSIIEEDDLGELHSHISPSLDYRSRMSTRTNYKWALNKAVQADFTTGFKLGNDEDEADEVLKQMKEENHELKKNISKLLRFNFSVDKFKVEPVYDSGFGNMIEVYNQTSYLVQSKKGKCFFLKYSKAEDKLDAHELSYNGVPLLILKTVYLDDLDILFISDREFLYKLKDGKISIEDELSKSAHNLLKKSDQGNTIIYLKNPKTLKILPIDTLLNKHDENFHINRMEFRETGSLRESKISMVDALDTIRASNMTRVGVEIEDSSLGKEIYTDTIQSNSNIIEAFLPEENVICIIDNSYFYKAYRIEKEVEDDKETDMFEDLIPQLPLFCGKSKIKMIASQRIYTVNIGSKLGREFHSSKNHLIVVNQMNAIDVFKFSSHYKLDYLASLKHQFSPMSFVKGNIEIFGNPIISIFQKRNDGFFEVHNYLYFDEKFILVENKKRRLLFKNILKVIPMDEKFVVISKGLDYYHQIKVNL